MGIEDIGFKFMIGEHISDHFVSHCYMVPT